MSIQTQTTFRNAAIHGERSDGFAMFALALSLALVILGLALIENPRADVEAGDPGVSFIAP